MKRTENNKKQASSQIKKQASSQIKESFFKHFYVFILHLYIQFEKYEFTLKKL